MAEEQIYMSNYLIRMFPIQHTLLSFTHNTNCKIKWKSNNEMSPALYFIFPLTTFTALLLSCLLTMCNSLLNTSPTMKNILQ